MKNKTKGDTFPPLKRFILLFLFVVHLLQFWREGIESDGRFMIIIIMRERERMYLGGQAEKETPWCFVHWGHRGPSTHTESASLRAHSPRAHHYWRMYNFFMSWVLCVCLCYACVHNEPIYCSVLMGWNMNWYMRVAWYCGFYIGEFECLAFTNRRETFSSISSY